MTRHSRRGLSNSREAVRTQQVDALETAHGELLDLRERVRKAELAAAKSIRSHREPPSPSRRRS
jgi:hypothetical protein